jgi:oligopeptide/dipeptide ABC transporter ATP-binding protein
MVRILTLEHLLLEVVSLRAYYATEKGYVRAVDGVSFSIRKEEIFGLVGESGCGKSTLALCIPRLVPRTCEIIDGKILLNGRNLLDLKEQEIRKIRGSRISMVFQNPLSSLNPVLTIEDQISEVFQLHRPELNENERKQEVANLLEKVGITDPKEKMRSYPHQLSGGMRQRIVFAIAFACSPHLLIADEPTTSLDVSVQDQILELMINLKNEYKSSVILISHDLGVIAQTCNSVAIMYAGKIMEYGDVVSIFKRTKHPYTELLLKSIPLYDKKEKMYSIPGRVPDLLNQPRGCRFHPRCPYALKLCKDREPELKKVDSNHYAACFRTSGGSYFE